MVTRRSNIFGLTALLLCLGMILQSCSGDDAGSGEPQTERTAMAFRTGVTRASSDFIAGESLPRGQSIGVFGFNQGTSTWDSWTAKTANLMYNQQMTYTGGEALEYSPLRYWIPGNRYSFFAYYPYSATDSGSKGIDINTDNIGQGQGAGSIEFTTQPLAADQTDLLVSDLVTDRVQESSDDDAPSVAFRLGHVLAGLMVTVDLSNISTATVTNYDTVEIKGIYTKGTLDVETKTWTPTDTGTVKALNYTVYNNDVRGLLLLIPQTIPADATIRVVVTTTEGVVSLPEQKLSALYPALNAGTRQTLVLKPLK